jgi:hypothetical protein
MRHLFSRSSNPRARPTSLAAGALALALAGLGSLALSGSAQAVCNCRCVDGKARAVCSSSTEIPPLCNNTLCPLSMPPKTPQDARQPVPTVTPGCETKQVYDPKAGAYAWEQVCQ